MSQLTWSSAARRGLLNRDAPDLGSMGSEAFPPVAYCTSIWCHKNDKGQAQHYGKGKQKQVGPQRTHCPDCNHLLHWRVDR